MITCGTDKADKICQRDVDTNRVICKVRRVTNMHGLYTYIDTHIYVYLSDSNLKPSTHKSHTSLLVLSKMLEKKMSYFRCSVLKKNEKITTDMDTQWNSAGIEQWYA